MSSLACHPIRHADRADARRGARTIIDVGEPNLASLQYGHQKLYNPATAKSIIQLIGCPRTLTVPSMSRPSIDYQPRLADGELRARLGATGGVLIEGPRGCGKTATARQAAASELLLDVDASSREAAAVAPEIALRGATPRLIDEWQLEPAIWNHVRREIDDRRTPGQFILTGSALPSDDLTRHTGALRITRLRMRPMSLFELTRSTGEISLARLLAGDQPAAADPGLDVADLAEAIAVGGWPGLREVNREQALIATRGYLDELRRADLGVPGESPRRDPAKLLALMRSLARNVATETPIRTLAADAGGADGPLHPETVRGYLDTLTRLMVVEDQPAWAPHLRSRYALRRSPKRHFVDPSLAVAALRATPGRLLDDLRYLGCLFESLVVRDLRIYAQALDSAAEVRHLRDSQGHEADAIIDLPDGRWAAFEIKLGSARIDTAAASLKALVRQIDTRASGEPAACAVIVGRGPGYRRPDGIDVVPIGALGP